MAKSSDLFALLVIPTSVKRDKSISHIFDIDIVEYPNPKYIAGGGDYGIFYTKNFNLIKTWKTYKGAISYLQNHVLVSSKKLGYQYLVLASEESDDGYNSNDWIDADYEIVPIVDKWNQHIANEFIIEKQRHSDIMIKLEEKIIK